MQPGSSCLLNADSTRERKQPPTFAFSHPTREEDRLKRAPLGASRAGARCRTSDTYSTYFICNPGFVDGARMRLSSARGMQAHGGDKRPLLLAIWPMRAGPVLGIPGTGLKVTLKKEPTCPYAGGGLATSPVSGLGLHLLVRAASGTTPSSPAQGHPGLAIPNFILRPADLFFFFICSQPRVPCARHLRLTFTVGRLWRRSWEGVCATAKRRTKH